jgi:hypothetical protein
MSYNRKSGFVQNPNTNSSHTLFDKLATEETQKEVVNAIKNIDISASIGSLTVNSSDTITHDKLDTLDATIGNKHLSSLTDSVSISGNVGITGTPSVNATITGTPSVNATITGTPSVNATITGTPSVNATITGTPSVSITGTPSVNATITGTPSVNATITGTPSVNATLVGEPSITISGTPSVNATITGTPSVNATITGTPSVSITGTPSVNATITGTPSVNATITGTPSVNATISGTPSVNATITGTPSVNATITGTPSVNATISGTPSVNATIIGTPNVNVNGSVSIPDLDCSKDSVSIYGYDGTDKVLIRTNTNGELLIGNNAITIEGTVSVDALPNIDAVSNSIQIFGNNGTTTNAIRTNVNGELKTEITNQISGYALESGGNLASIKTNTDRIKSDTTNPDAIQVQVKNSSLTVDGSVNVNTISGFALESGGNLASIKTNTDRIHNDTTNTDAIQVQVKNSSLTVDGSVNVNTISGFALESGGNLASIKTNTDRIKSDTTNPDAIQVQVKNTSINTTSKMQDGAGNALTSSAISGGIRALDVNLAGGSISVGSVNIKDTSGYTLSAVSQYVPQLKTTLYSEGAVPVSVRPLGSTYANSMDTYNKILDDCYISSATSITTIPKLYINGSSPNQYTAARCNGNGDQFVSLSTNSGGNTVQFDNSTANGNKIKIDSTTGNNIVAIASGQNVGITSSQNTVKIDSTTNKIKIDNGTYTAGVLPTITNLNTSYGLITDSALFGLNIISGDIQPLTVNLNGGKNQLEVRDNDAVAELTSIDNKLLTTANEYGRSGLNMYQIYPKKIHYTLSGRSESGAQAVIMGGTGSQKFIYDFTFGKATPQTFSAILSAGTTTSRTLKYHYVNNLGDLKTDGSITISTTANVNLTPSNIISINKFWIEGVIGLTEQALIRVGTGNTAINTIASTDNNDYYNGVITVPNGYIGYLTQFSVYSPSAIWFQVQKWDENSNRIVVYSHLNGANAPVQSGYNGSIGMIFTAGESIAFSKDASGASTICGNFVLEPI